MTTNLNLPFDAIGWAKSHNLEVSDHLASVLAAVAQYADPDGRNSHEGYDVLAEASGKSGRQVQRAIEELQRLGLLTPGGKAPSWEALRANNRPRNWDVPALAGGRWERPGGALSGERCEAVSVKALVNRVDKINNRVDMAPPGALSTDRFTAAETLLNEINHTGTFAPTAYRLARNLLCAAMKNGHSPEWLRTLLAEPVADDGPAASSQILVRLHAHQHQPTRTERPPATEQAQLGAGNQAFVTAFDMAHQIARAQQTPRRQYFGHDFAELLHLLVAAALNGATRAELERIVGEDPPAGGDRTSHVLGSLWALARGEIRPPSSAKTAYTEEPVRVLVPVDVRDESLDNALADQDGPIPADEAATWAGRIVRRIVLAHGALDDEQDRELRWRLVKALKNGQPPAHLARVLTRPAVTTDPCSELLHRASLHYWPGRTP